MNELQNLNQKTRKPECQAGGCFLGRSFMFRSSVWRRQSDKDESMSNAFQERRSTSTIIFWFKCTASAFVIGFPLTNLRDAIQVSMIISMYVCMYACMHVCLYKIEGIQRPFQKQLNALRHLFYRRTSANLKFGFLKIVSY